MFVAILTAIIIVIVAVVAVVLVVRTKKVKPGGFVPKSVTSIGSATPFQTRSGQSMSASAGAHQSSNGPLMERLKPRYTALAILIAGIFGSLTTKLWGLQVLSSSEYQAASEANKLTTIKTPAPRGRIFDASGIVLVDNKIESSIMADADVAQDRNVLMRLSALTGIPYAIVRQRIQDASGGAQAQREVASNPRARDIAFIAEHPDAFEGVSVQERAHRVYPYSALAGQVLGYVGTVSEDALKNTPEGQDYQSGDEVGQSGVELAYDSVLLGAHGERVVVADVDGTVHEVKSETQPTQGNDLYLTISAQVQKIAEDALHKLIAPHDVIGEGTGTSGAVVAMEVDTGAVLAMANFPTFDPTNFVGGITQEDWERYNSQDSHSPLLNRCISGQYPAASTFKAFSGMAGLHYGFADSMRAWDCTGRWTGFGKDFPQNCWKTDGHGATTFYEAIVVSCDVVFYEIAKDFYNASARIGEDAMQDYIKEFGFGNTTGIELAGETPGVIPTPTWKKEAFKDAPEEGSWRPGDMSNMVIGQGNVLITPLQLAVGYAGIATGKLPVPTLMKEVRNSLGEVVLTSKPETRDLKNVTETELQVMREALRGVATEDADVPDKLAKYDFECACKTGTGEWAEHDGYAWFAMYAPYDDPKYVVTCVVQEGGSGGSTALPIASKVMDACIKFGKGKLKTKVGPTKEVTDSIEYAGTGAGRVD